MNAFNLWGLLYFSMAFLAFKGQNFFIKTFLFKKVEHGYNLVNIYSLVSEIQRRLEIANKTGWSSNSKANLISWGFKVI